MKNKYLLLIFAALLLANSGFAQGVCGTFEGSFEQDKQKYPEFYQSLESVNAELEQQHKSALSKMTNLKSENGKKIIPVVVHVIHDMGGENISDVSIQTALDALNKNINGQSDKLLSSQGQNPLTPNVFAAVRGDLNVEFRLAKIDPSGNPTTGINRVRSLLTELPEPHNQIKRLSYWNSYQYLNVWVVKEFSDNGGLQGYAQFPWSGSMSTDGVVAKYSAIVGSDVTTLTHEVGHWLGLKHTWGDAECGNDDIFDTPPQKYDNNGASESSPTPLGYPLGSPSTFPYNVGDPPGILGGCLGDSLNWAGEMFMNYMSYTADQWCTMFTKGQDVAMNETLEGLEGEVGYREYLWSDDNVASTGSADGYKPPTCSQEASFNFSGGTSPMVCEGERIFLQGNKGQFGNGNVTSFIWDYGNGETDNTGDNNIQYIYPETGNYDVTLTIEYTETTEARAFLITDLDLSNATSWETIATDEIVQGTEAELINMGASNITEISIDSLGVYFGMEDSSYFRGVVPTYINIAYYTNSCTSSITKDNFIVIGPAASTNTASSYSYSFESENDLSGDWNIVSSSDVESVWSFNTNESSTWEWVNAVAKQGSASIKINGERGASGSHEIISIAYDLSGLTDPAIKFSWSGAAVNYFPENDLKITYSKNCGEDWLALATLSPVDAANAGLYTTNFKPEDKEWRDTILTKSQLKDDNIRFKFEYNVNGRSNNFYLDNIQIGEESSLFQSEISTANKLSIFPNPTPGEATIVVENLAKMDVQVSLVNILGAEVRQLFDGTIISNFQTIDAELSFLEKGIYFVKVTHKGDIILTDKLILNK